MKEVEKMGLTEYLYLLLKLNKVKDSLFVFNFLSTQPKKIISDFVKNDLFPYLKQIPNKISKFRKPFPKLMDYFIRSQLQTSGQYISSDKDEEEEGEDEEEGEEEEEEEEGGEINITDMPDDTFGEIFEFVVEKPKELLDLLIGVVGKRYQTFITEHTNAYRNIIWTPQLIEKSKFYMSGPPYNEVYKLSLTYKTLSYIPPLPFDPESEEFENLSDYDLEEKFNFEFRRNMENYPKMINKYPNLWYLILNKTIMNYAEISNMIQLEGLEITGKYDIIRIVRNLINLEVLKLTLNSFNAIEGFIGLTKLKRLSITNNSISVIGIGLRTLTNLLVLNLARNQIIKIEGLNRLTNLLVLNLAHNQITEIEGLNRLTKLKKLNLWDNKIEKIEGLDNLTNLKKLNLGENQITKIEGLDNLKKLETLSFRGNQITKIEGLGNLKKLERLSFRGNQITKIEGLGNLKKLERLNFRGNQITKFEGLDNLKKLEKLSFRGNQITRIGLIPIGGLESLENLLSLDYSGNPLILTYRERQFIRDREMEFNPDGNFIFLPSDYHLLPYHK